MAAINDNAGIVTGATLDAWNQMQALVLRDNDVAGAQAELMAVFTKVAHTKRIAIGTGSVTVHRAP